MNDCIALECSSASGEAPSIVMRYSTRLSVSFYVVIGPPLAATERRAHGADERRKARADITSGLLVHLAQLRLLPDSTQQSTLGLTALRLVRCR